MCGVSSDEEGGADEDDGGKAGVYRCSRSTNRSTELIGNAFQQLKIVTVLHASTARNNH